MPVRRGDEIGVVIGGLVIELNPATKFAHDEGRRMYAVPVVVAPVDTVA